MNTCTCLSCTHNEQKHCLVKGYIHTDYYTNNGYPDDILILPSTLLGKYAKYSPFMNIQSIYCYGVPDDCDCVSCQINEPCLVFGYTTSFRPVFSKVQLGNLYQYSPYYTGKDTRSFKWRPLPVEHLY
jgi:hypothetical protein